MNKNLILCSSLFILILSIKGESTLNVDIQNPPDKTYFRQGNIVTVSGVYSCDQTGYNLQFYVDGNRQNSIPPSTGINIPFSFSWNTTNVSGGSHILTVQLYRQGCDAASDSITTYICVLDHIKISPSIVKVIYCGESKVFVVIGYDQYGNEFPLDASKVIWNTDYGTMNPWRGSTSSTFIAPTFPKINNTITATYESKIDFASVRVYPKIGNFKVNVSRTWDPFPLYFSVRLAQLNLEDTYGRVWGSLPDYPFPRYQYYNCRDGVFGVDTPAFTFPPPLFSAIWVIVNGLNVTEFVDVYWDGMEGSWPSAGYDSAQDGYTWNAVNVYDYP